ncbi:unnamed protein product [Spirodela intermedia]|uniref:DNA-directed DNA polymerase n=1 Tax=Spirodela intermedia TaxID=51605 RepID=A0A7I8IPW7_SPIIN|nr:unnamed protein product [Spirodela intermedia]CAA6659614.1 unnamed protein product [Spirodela intermedia]
MLEGRRHSVDVPFQKHWWRSKEFDLFEEEVDSYRDLHLEVPEMVNRNTRKKTLHSELRRPAAAAEKTDRRYMGSPYLSPSDNAFSPRTLGFFNDEPDVTESNQNGCGLGSCWSRTPKYRDLGGLSDGEEQSHPLLVGEVHKPAFKERNPYPDSPRGLSQKFRPRSFDEFVGQPVVVQSLLNAICKAKVCPMYLFYGPQGTGKTSMARIFAASLNCLSFGEKMPCGICRECVSFFSGRSRDIKELDPSHINCKDKVKALLKSTSLVPSSSHYRVFIIDECQSLLVETWAAILKSLTELPRQTVFIMITSDLEKLPPISLSRCQKYHFTKLKDADIVWRLQKICVEEAYDFDDDALTFIAVKSNGSLREAETLLDQLSLLGKRITVSLAHELTGVVSEDELLDLLDLALSSDTSNTVRRARELMSSRVDPMQLTSQLANLIMDIIAGRCRPEKVGRKFFGGHKLADLGLQKLRNALKVLSETDKQLRSSKSCATWLTVALLQFNTGDPTDIDDSMTLVRTSNLKDEPLCRSFSTRESLQSSLCECSLGRSNCFEGYCNATKKLDTIWRRTIESCQSDPPRSFLKKGRLASIYLKQGLAIAQVEFSSPEYVSRAEASWKLITNSLQHVLCHNVELRISLARCSSLTKAKELTYKLLGCSGKRQYTFDSLRQNHSLTLIFLRNT